MRCRVRARPELSSAAALSCELAHLELRTGRERAATSLQWRVAPAVTDRAHCHTRDTVRGTVQHSGVLLYLAFRVPRISRLDDSFHFTTGVSQVFRVYST